MAAVKKIGFELEKSECTLLVQALDALQAQVKRALAKETDEVIRSRREAQIVSLRNIQNAILYSGKDLV